MAVDMFIKLEGIEGESKDHKHQNEVDVLAWSWGMSQSGSFATGGGAGTGKANFQDISFTKYTDKSSNLLMLHCATGKHIPTAQIVVRKAGDKALEYLMISMEEVYVTSVSTGGSGGDERQTENVTLNFAKVEYKYKEQKPDGTGEAEKLFWYSIKENQGGA